MKTVFIYSLNDPITGAVRYVGKTNNPALRLRQHLTCRRTGYRTNWIQLLVSRGLKPVLEIVDEVSEVEWPSWEVAYIEFFRNIGCSLVNTNEGGKGGINPSDETRTKISVSISKIMRGAGNPNFGKQLSESHKKKLSESAQGHTRNRGRKHSAETCLKMSISKKLYYARRNSST